MLYVWDSCIKAGHFALHSIIEYHMWKLLLVYHIAYYKSIKPLYTFIQQTIKVARTRRHLPLFTFTLISGDT